MSAGKYLSLEEVRHDPKLLRHFVKEHVSEGDQDIFDGTLAAMIKSSPAAGKTSLEAHGDHSSGTRIHRDKKADT